MSKLFTDEYCVHISWTGRGWVKDMTKLKETELIEIVKSNLNKLKVFNDLCTYASNIPSIINCQT